MTHIILCGGAGTRLWPLSRELMPKQFIKFFGSKGDEKSLFQLCIERNRKFCAKNLIVSNEEQYFLALDQITQLGGGGFEYSFLLEPQAKNTAAAICLATLSLSKDELCLVTPSDHLIKDDKAYEKVIQKASKFAQDDYLVTLGIKPHYAETGFGYIKAGENDEALGFYEKPNLKTAQSYVKAKNFFWNSGIFIFKAEFFLKQMQKFAPAILKACQNALKNSHKENALLRIRREDMAKIPESSIDYALMEKAQRMKLIKANMAWSDVGSFDALYDEFDKDKAGNVLKANALNLDSKGNLIYASNPKKLIATADTQNLIIIDTEDTLMICQRGKSQRVKELVSQLDTQSKFRKIHLTAHRPWGTYTVLEDEKGYKLKRLEVKPHKKLSLQKHFHRNEHWIVVSGTATVVVGDETRLVRPNESTYIKMGEIHRLSNEGKIPVVLIEAQVGEYTEEDDIVRLDDEFHRV